MNPTCTARRWFVLIAMAFMSLIVCPSIASAQKPDAPGVGSNMITNFKGKLVSFKRGILVVTTDEGTQMNVALPDDIASFVFVAEAKPAFLQRGMFVRFSGSFNQAGMAQSPIRKVEIFQPVAGKLNGHQREAFVPGIYPVNRPKAAEPPPQVADVKVVGNIMGMDASGVMGVMIGKQPLQVPLAPDVRLELRFNNMSLAEEGDSVSVAGFYQAGDETNVKASRITITTSRVYGEATEGNSKSTRKRTRSSRKKTDDADTGNGENPDTAP
ncbi:hypothetical protein N9N28_13500 [Rubripirellula amarantea]|nr:hypothetical protein [Rubripirellula amarantea]